MRDVTSRSQGAENGETSRGSGRALGGIETARGPEHYIFLSMALMRTLGTTGYGIAMQREE